MRGGEPMHGGEPPYMVAWPAGAEGQVGGPGGAPPGPAPHTFKSVLVNLHQCKTVYINLNEFDSVYMSSNHFKNGFKLGGGGTPPPK